MSADEKELSHKSFDNTPTGIQSLLDWIAGYHLSLSKLLFCAENMGSYVTELSVSSVSMGFSLALVCPLTIKKSIGLQRGKNDRIDAKRIANYAVLHYRKLELYKLPDKDLVRLRGWIIIRDNLAVGIKMARSGCLHIIMVHMQRTAGRRLTDTGITSMATELCRQAG